MVSHSLSRGRIEGVYRLIFRRKDLILRNWWSISCWLGLMPASGIFSDIWSGKFELMGSMDLILVIEGWVLYTIGIVGVVKPEFWGYRILRSHWSLKRKFMFIEYNMSRNNDCSRFIKTLISFVMWTIS